MYEQTHREGNTHARADPHTKQIHIRLHTPTDRQTQPERQKCTHTHTHTITHIRHRPETPVPTRPWSRTKQARRTRPPRDHAEIQHSPPWQSTVPWETTRRAESPVRKRDRDEKVRRREREREREKDWQTCESISSVIGMWVVKYTRTTQSPRLRPGFCCVGPLLVMVNGKSQMIVECVCGCVCVCVCGCCWGDREGGEFLSSFPHPHQHTHTGRGAHSSAL
jgi:hypothetical protein